MISIDGAMGEGGGQVLRSSLALSVLTGQPFRAERIRAKRSRPGLRRQHLTAVRAAAAISGADVRGDAVGSTSLEFVPHGVFHGDHRFDVGTAGSATLVLQTVLMPLSCVAGRSRLTLIGGTHNHMAPPYDYLDRVFLPALRSMGARVSATMVRSGFYPAGQGELRVEIEGPAVWSPLALLERGAFRARSARILIARLPAHVADREARRIRDRLAWTEVDIERIDGAGPGNAVLLELEHEHVIEVFTGFGERGVPAEKVADAAIAGLRAYADATAPVGPHLADQLLLPLAVGAGGRFRATELTLHTRTNADVIRRFVDAEIDLGRDGDGWRVDVRPAR